MGKLIVANLTKLFSWHYRNYSWLHFKSRRRRRHCCKWCDNSMETSPGESQFSPTLVNDVRDNHMLFVTWPFTKTHHLKPSSDCVLWHKTHRRLCDWQYRAAAGSYGECCVCSWRLTLLLMWFHPPLLHVAFFDICLAGSNNKTAFPPKKKDGIWFLCKNSQYFRWNEAVSLKLNDTSAEFRHHQ